MVQFYPWFKFSFLLFLGMVMYDNNMITSLKQKKRKFEPRIKLNHNIYMYEDFCCLQCSDMILATILLDYRALQRNSLSTVQTKCKLVVIPHLVAFTEALSPFSDLSCQG